MGYLATVKIFENILQLEHFDLYLKKILTRKYLLSYKYSDISYRDARVFGGICTFPEKI